MQDPWRELGKLLLLAGALMAVVGLLLVTGSKLPFRIGKLPGDLVMRRDHFTLYLPIASSILVSILLMLLIWLFRRR